MVESRRSSDVKVWIGAAVYDNTIVSGEKDHENHVPSSETRTWVKS